VRLLPLLVTLLATNAASASAADEPTRWLAACADLADAGRFREALPDCQEAVRLRRARGDETGLGEALNRLGLTLEMLGERAAAAAAYDEALALHRRLGQAQAEALVLSNLAAFAIGGGDYGTALRRLGEEEAVALRSGDAPWVGEELRVVAQNRAVTLEHLGAYREALRTLRDLSRAGEPDPSIAAALEVNLAVLYRNVGDPRRALALLERAAATYRSRDDLSALANLELNRGLVHALNLRAPAAAEAAFRAALELARRSGDRGEEIRSLCALGELLLAEQRLDDAASPLDGCLELAREGGAREAEWTALAGLGRLARARGDRASALAGLGAAIARIEEIGERSGSVELKGGFLSDRRGVYAAAVDLLAESALAGDPAAAAAALAMAERAKARELLDLLAAGSGRPASAAELAALGRSHGPLLAYFAGERTLWRWLLTADGISLAAAGDAREIDHLVRAQHSRLARGLEPEASALARLTAALLPAAIPDGELRIAPDGSLFYLPFELLDEPAGAASLLLERRAVSYLPSLSLLAGRQSPRPPPALRFVGLANPRLPTLTPQAAGAASLLAERFGLAALPAAERETELAAERLGGSSVVERGAGASETRLRELAGRGTAVLHLAAHTVVDEELLAGVALFLAADPANDGFLTAAELAGLSLQVDLAVLSGCRTALGARGDGRALASLSGALLGAGARGVVASLWEVGDRSTAALMEQFYFQLSRGLAPAEALRRAKLRLRADARWHPAALWAGFVVLGDPAAMAPSSRIPARSLVGIGLALAALAGGGMVWWRSLS